MKVTIFGTCRQHSIKDICKISFIQENLTYPYNTRELIQAIRYCKDEKIMDDSMTQYCFRSGILNKKPLNQQLFVDEYNSSDIFLIEIPSRNYHMYKGYAVHQILQEEGVTKHKLTDKEIEEDIITVKNLLYPKPFIIVSHIYTYEQGERYELVKLLERITNKYEIPFINPMNTLKHYPIENIFVNESKLSHYTDFGHSIMKKVYLDKIFEIMNN